MVANLCYKPTFSGWYERDLGQLEGDFLILDTRS
jgi:hypothetical protein